MKRLNLTVIILLFVISGVANEWPEIRMSTRVGTTSNNHFVYHGELARSTHPLSFLKVPEVLPLSSSAIRFGPSVSGYLPENNIRRNPDLLFPMPKLRTQHADLDLNEPVSRRFLVGYLAQEPFPSMITLSQERYVQLKLDNDIFNYTDRFYTNGIRLAVVTPMLRENPLSKLLIPYWNSGINYYGISLVQNMYTPSTTKIGGILRGDRPYAAYLYVGSYKITNDMARMIRLTSEIQTGILGPSSLGEYVQRTFHHAVPTNNEPLGWEFQIRDDLLLNYVARIEKSLVSIRGLDFLVHGTGSLGTVYTNIGGGAYFRTGWFNNYFMNLSFSKKSLNLSRNARNLQFYFFACVSGEAVGYDATLQGGLFNRTSPYTIPADRINRLMFSGSGGFVFTYGGMELKGEQFLLSPEFQDGWWHKWLSIGLSFSF